MNYNCFLIKTQDYEKYPEISELFPGDPESDDIIIGADNGEDSIILALMIGSISITDRSAACVSYVWRRRQDTDEEIFRDMLEAFRKELKSRNITPISANVSILAVSTTVGVNKRCGPTSIPAIIYPRTTGCFILLNNKVVRAAVTNIKARSDMRLGN